MTGPRFCAEALGGPGRPGARHSWASEETAIDPYRVLGVARDASPEEVRGAY